MDYVGPVKRIKNGQHLVRILFVLLICKRPAALYLLGGDKRPRPRMTRKYRREV